MASTNVFLPLKVQQLVDLVKQLPKKQKKELVHFLLQDDEIISEKQKQLVLLRVKKYQARPDDLVDEEDAWKVINAD